MPFCSSVGKTFDEKEQFYQGIVGEVNEEAMVFASKRLLRKQQREHVVASDPTYKITPRLLGALQVLIVAVMTLGRVSITFLFLQNSIYFNHVHCSPTHIVPKQCMVDVEL